MALWAGSSVDVNVPCPVVHSAVASQGTWVTSPPFFSNPSRMRRRDLHAVDENMVLRARKSWIRCPGPAARCSLDNLVNL